MTDNQPEFSPEQWKFIAVFEASGTSISLDIAATVSPLLPSRLLDAIKKALANNILEDTREDTFRAEKSMPDGIKTKLAAINTKERVSRILDRLSQTRMLEELSPGTYANILARSGRETGGQLEIDLAQKLLEVGQYDKALPLYKNGLNGLIKRAERTKDAKQFIYGSLGFSDLAFSIGSEFVPAYRFLKAAAPMAKKMGDLRAAALIDLHIGRQFYIGNRRHEAVAMMKSAETIINDLGDKDIKIRAAEFLALYYYMQGRFQEAMGHFETGFRAFEERKGSGIANPSAPVFYGFCAAYLGQFHKAIGSFDSAWRRARRAKNHAQASILRASLGMILLLTKKGQEAAHHIKSALKESRTHGNIFGWYFASGYHAYLHYLGGDIPKAYKILEELTEKGKQSNIVYQFSSPWLLEMFFALRAHGQSIFRDQGDHKDILRLLADPSMHIRGVLLRQLALTLGKEKISQTQINDYISVLKNNNDIKQAPKSRGVLKRYLLEISETLLKPTGDPVQLAKTRIELARLAIKAKNRQAAVKLAEKARKGLSGFWEDYFPDDFRRLLDERTDSDTQGKKSEISSEKVLQAMEELAPSLEIDDFFHRMLTTMNRLLRAERGGLFWKDPDRPGRLLLKVGRNLPPTETGHKNFQSNMTAICKSFDSGTPLLIRPDYSKKKPRRQKTFSLVCIPLKQAGETSGVLYCDNSYLEDSFDFLDEPLLEKLASHLAIYIDRILKIEALVAQAHSSGGVHELSGRSDAATPFIAQSAQMTALFSNSDKVAASDTAVLIQGETGVGKELMAQRLHQLSPRHNKPFIIIDPTTIPDNLVESELFGYEKGAFTGADRRKRGRVELAHQGTLFIDEIGEMHKSIQAKLLRVLQEKTFVRIGGSQPIHSDFRLLAATNRDLAAEVAKGNFREDLFYRISIVPIHIPPLRERGKDILLLAEHFLDRFSQKHHHQNLALSDTDKQALLNYPFPGNVRELINIIERAVILSRGEQLSLNLEPSQAGGSIAPFADMPPMDTLQRRYIEYVLNKTEGRIGGKGGAAEILCMKRSTLYSRMDKLGISRR